MLMTTVDSASLSVLKAKTLMEWQDKTTATLPAHGPQVTTSGKTLLPRPALQTVLSIPPSMLTTSLTRVFQCALEPTWQSIPPVLVSCLALITSSETIHPKDVCHRAQSTQ